MLREVELPVAVSARSGELRLRRATANDLPRLLRMLADDEVSRARGDAARQSDEAVLAHALRAIQEDSANDLVVALDPADRAIGMLQLTVIPGLARRGATRLLVESVRVDERVRSSGVGGAMMRWVRDIAAPALGAGLVQLTSDSQREDAHRFYRSLGFVDSHVGFKWKVPRDL